MKITAFITEKAIQFNLESENDHEKKFMAMLTEYTGEVQIHTGVSVNMCQGGYIRDFGEEKNITAITIRKPKQND